VDKGGEGMYLVLWTAYMLRYLEQFYVFMNSWKRGQGGWIRSRSARCSDFFCHIHLFHDDLCLGAQ
jgi:hypothetical protein